MSSTLTSEKWPNDLTRHDKAEQKRMVNNMLPVFKKILSDEKIDATDDFIRSLDTLYLPFSSWLASQHQEKPIVIGINGSQGSGKSTLTRIIHCILENIFDKSVVSLSIDDLYKSKHQRLMLAKETHPLLVTRGVPGTHDTELGISILKHLKNQQSSEIKIPRFDKSIDDQATESSWNKVDKPCDIIIFEGWCVGSIPEDKKDLLQAVNSLEKFEDIDGTWRAFVNQKLANEYSDLFALIDILVMLKIPNFEKVHEWRSLQEHKLKQSVTSEQRDSAIMNNDDIKRFIMHYERITRHTLNEMPGRADVVFNIGNDHQIQSVKVRT